jgi:putative endonuclease
VDLVIRCAGVVAFVEVKTRAGDGCGDPLEAITPWKRREVERVARAWLRIRGGMLEGRHAFRFDAVAVIIARGRPPDVRHVPDAWCAADCG